MIVVSATTAIGGMACIEVFRPACRIDDRAEPNPSWDAAVGIETNGMFLLKPACLARSIGRPPPTPIRKSIPSTASSTRSNS